MSKRITSLSIDEALWQQVKMFCLISHTNVGDFVEDSLKKAMFNLPQKESVRRPFEQYQDFLGQILKKSKK